MVLDELYNKRRLACCGGASQYATLTGVNSMYIPTEREPSTAIFLFFRMSPGIVKSEEMLDERNTDGE
jgi:hypothetical protein